MAVQFLNFPSLVYHYNGPGFLNYIPEFSSEIDVGRLNFTLLLLTNGLHHAGLSCVSLHWNDVLEAMQWNDALFGIPYLKNVLHFAAQFLSQKRNGKVFYI